MAISHWHVRLGTRGSLLARMQSQQVADSLMRVNPGARVDLVILKTTGDQVVDRPLHAIGGKGLFTKELELALLRNEIDFAVHSYKDVPVTMPLVDQSGLVTAAVPKREDPSDALVSRQASSLTDLPRGAKVGTGSLRRRSQILAARPDVNVEMIRGNIDTRMKKIDAGLDAVVLATAGLRRASLFDPATCHVLSELLPAPGQGALALQCRREDERTRMLLATIDDLYTSSCVHVERELVRLLNGDCHSPIGALATILNNVATLESAIGHRDGHPPLLRATATVPVDRLPHLAKLVFDQLAVQGVREIL